MFTHDQKSESYIYLIGCCQSLRGIIRIAIIIVNEATSIHQRSQRSIGYIKYFKKVS